MSRKPSLKTYRWIMSVIGSRWWMIAYGCVMSAIGSITGIAYALLMKHAVDAVTAKDAAGFWKYTGIFAAVVVFQIVLDIIDNYVNAYAGQTFTNSFQVKVFEGMLRGDYATISRLHTGELVNRLTSDVSVVLSGVMSLLPSLISMVIQIVGVIVVMYYIAPQLTWIFVIAGILMVLLSLPMRGILKRMHKQVQAAGGVVRSYIQESLESILVIKVFGAESRIVSGAWKRMNALKKVVIKRANFSIFVGTGLTLAMQLGQFIGFAWCGYGILAGTMTYGTLTALMSLIGQIQSPIVSIGGIFPQLATISASAERLMELLPEYQDHYTLALPATSAASDELLESVAVAENTSESANGSASEVESVAAQETREFTGEMESAGAATGITPEMIPAAESAEAAASSVGADGIRRAVDHSARSTSPAHREDLAVLHDPDAFYRNMKSIDFRDVTFSYGRSTVLDDFSISIHKGEFIGIVGESGIGKSTMMKLLVHAYRAQSGTVKAHMTDEAPISPIDVIDFPQGLFAYVPQGNFLLSGTVREVVSFNEEPDIIDDDAIKQACHVACADEFIEQLPERYDTMLGERGAGLSEGQMQRVAIARALYSGAPILLLDESTSALDVQTERELLQSIRALSDETVIIVTHRPEVLRICDTVIRMEAGGHAYIIDASEVELDGDQTLTGQNEPAATPRQ